jgi:hypothetical protein
LEKVVKGKRRLNLKVLGGIPVILSLKNLLYGSG